MNISIPENLRSYVEEKVRDGGYGSVSEYIRELIRNVRAREARAAEVRELLKAGLDQIMAGDFEELDDRSIAGFIEKVRGNARNRLKRKASGKG